MTTQNETNSNYDHQSFDHYPKAPIFPTGWDLSEMESDTKSAKLEANASSNEEEPANL